MRRVAVLLAALVVLTGCGSSRRDTTPDAGAITVSGHVVLAGGTGAHAVVALTHDNRCFGVGPNSAFVIDAPITVQAGSHRYTAELGPGDIITPGNGQVVTGCEFPFTVADVTSTASGYTMTVAGVNRTFTRGELAAPVTVRVSGRPST